MRIYCPSCGKPNEYSDLKPTYCGFCSSVLSVNASNPKTVVVPRTKITRRPIIQDEDDYVTDGTLPDIQKLDVEIEIPEPVREKVGDVWGSGALGGMRPKPKKTNKSEALAKFTKGIFKKAEIDLNPNEQ